MHGRKCILSNERTGADYDTNRYESLHERIKYLFANCMHPDVMTSVSNLFKITMYQESARNIHLRGSSSALSTVREVENHRRTAGELEDMGMSGLGCTSAIRGQREYTDVGHAWIGVSAVERVRSSIVGSVTTSGLLI